MNTHDRSANSGATIQLISTSGLCTGCGTCYGICPHNAIHYDLNSKTGLYVFNVLFDRCKSCGLCLNSCPGIGVNMCQMNLRLFQEIPAIPLLGYAKKCFSGFATDKDLRYRATSGGVTTALMKFALQSGFVDGAIVTGYNERNPLQSKAYIARSAQELENAIGSKYCPSATNIVLKDIIRGGGKFILVGLPCHIHGLRKSQMILPKLNKAVVLQIALFCGMNFSYRHLNWLLRHLGVERADVSRINYRGSGYPGEMRIDCKGNKSIVSPLHQYYVNAFKATRCTLCPDTFGELADISIGDAWLPEYRDDKLGRNIVVGRSRAGLDFLENAQCEKAVCFDAISPEKVLESNHEIATFKDDCSSRVALLRMLGKRTPSYVYEGRLKRRALAGLIEALVFYVNKTVKMKLYEMLPPAYINRLRGRR